MNRSRIITLLFFIYFCVSCTPADQTNTTTTPFACYGSAGIVIVLGLVMGYARYLRMRNSSPTPKESEVGILNPIKASSNPSNNEKGKSGTKNNEATNINSNDLDSKVEAVKRYVQGPIPDNNLPHINNPGGASNSKQVINIHIDPDEVKAQAATEIVDVPNGVTIKVKRIRTVEHTLSIEWAAVLSAKGEVGIKQLVSASIQGEIQRIKGYTLQQTESLEYEVTLNGERDNQYKLVWVDIWLKGTADIVDGNNSYSQPFQFRDRTELKVLPFKDS